MAETVVVPRKRGRSLRSAENIRACLAALYRKVESGSDKLDADRVKLQVRICEAMLKAIESDDARFDRKLKAHLRDFAELKRLAGTRQKALGSAKDEPE
jgi:hypothetical protein